MRQFRFLVNERFRGAEGTEIDVATGYGGGDCGYGFRVGDQYLVYANNFLGTLSTGICSRTRPISQAAEDLDFLRSAATATAGSSILGKITAKARDPVMGVAVIATSDAGAVHRTATDSNGKFAFQDLPPGRYTVQPLLPESLTVSGRESLVVNVADRGCAESNFYAVPNGRISGRLFDATGGPAAKVEVQVLQLTTDENAAYSFLGKGVSTYRNIISDSEGRFEFKGLSSGVYVLGISLTNPPWSTGFPKTFYAGATLIEGATRFQLDNAQHISGLEFHLPPPMRRIPQLLRVVWSDGRPVAGAGVVINDPEYNGPPLQLQTDANGRVTANIFDGKEYQLFASAPVPGKQCSSDATFTARDGVTVPALTIDPAKCKTY